MIIFCGNPCVEKIRSSRGMVELAEVLLTISTSGNRVRPSITTRSSSPLENGERKSMYTVSQGFFGI